MYIIYEVEHMGKGNYKRINDIAEKFALFIFCTLSSFRQVRTTFEAL